MNTKKNKKQVLNLQVADGLTVAIIPDSDHEFLMSTKQVALGYGVAESTIRSHRQLHPSELIIGRHYAAAVEIFDSKNQAVHNKVFWTKRGIVRLGFFIKSERAKLFRDWAEELVISKLGQVGKTRGLAPGQTPGSLPPRRRHNRLTSDRLIDIMADVARIDDREVRISITNKLLGGC